MATKTQHIVTKTVQTRDKSGEKVTFTASPKPQDLGEHGASAVKAGCAVVYKPETEDSE